MNYLENKKLKVDDVKSMLSMQAAQELSNTVLFIIEKIFNGEDCYWDLMSKVKSNDDGTKILDQLSPNGEIMKVILELMFSGKATSIYEFPVSKLSEYTRLLINNNNVPEYLRNKLVYRTINHLGYNQGKVVQLNVFEYFLFSFVTYPLNCQFITNFNRKTYSNGSVSNLSVSGLVDTIYCQLLVRYLDFFLLRDPTATSLIQATLQSRNNHNNHHHRVAAQSFDLSHRSFHTTMTPLYQDISLFYYTNTFICIINEFWLNYFVDLPTLTTNTCSINPPTELLPSLHLVCFVRIFLKHIYHFCYTKSIKIFNPNTQFEMEFQTQLNQYRGDYISPFIVPKFTDYLMKLFRCWPADLTFKMILETWLSAIQPWRYSDSPQHENANISEWKLTITNDTWENIWLEKYCSQMYGAILLLLSKRLLRTDMMVLRNCQMVYRIAKVLQQVSTDGANYLKRNQQFWQQICQRMTPVLDDIQEKLDRISKERNCGEISNNSSNTADFDDTNKGWLSWLKKVAINALSGNDSEMHKIESYLKYSFDVLGGLFEYANYHQTPKTLPLQTDMAADQNQFQPGINIVKPQSIHSTVDYYQKPITIYEVSWLVIILAYLSQFMSKSKMGISIKRLCTKDDWKGMVLRVMFMGFGVTSSMANHVEPQLRLRFLANKALLFWCGFAGFIIQLINGVFLEALFTLSLLTVSVIVWMVL